MTNLIKKTTNSVWIDDTSNDFTHLSCEFDEAFTIKEMREKGKCKICKMNCYYAEGKNGGRR